MATIDDVLERLAQASVSDLTVPLGTLSKRATGVVDNGIAGIKMA